MAAMFATDREQARQEIKRRFRCEDYLERSPNGASNMYICPFCGSGTGEHRTGALKVYTNTNTWCCFACQPDAGQKYKTGDVIDIYMQVNGITDYNEALLLMAEQAGITIDRYDPAGGAGRTQRRTEAAGRVNIPESEQRRTDAPTTPQKDFTEYYRRCRAQLNDPAAAAYLQKRGISTATAEYYWLGYDPEADPANNPGAAADEYKPHPCPRIIIPTTRAHYVGRRIDGGKEHEKMNPKKEKGAGAPGIFNARALYTQDVREVFVVEGAFDALSIIEAGGTAIALNTNSGNTLLEMLKSRGTGATLILCPDNDPDPETAEKTKNKFNSLQEGLRAKNIPCVTADINCGRKDANEALTADRGAFIESVQTTIQEVRQMAEQQEQEKQRAEIERQQRTGASMVDAFLESVQSHKYEPVQTGISDLDNAIGGGFIRQQIILLGAAPGAGKTGLAQWIFEGMAAKGQPCLFLNLEMSRDQMLARSLSRIAKQDKNEIKPTDILQGYKWDEKQKGIILSAAERYKEEIAPRMIYNPEGVKAELDSILEYITGEAKKAEAAKMQAPCVVIDYLQLIRGKEREDSAEVIKRAMDCLKRFAIQHNTFVFVIMANNRKSNETGDVTMESGRDTSALEYGADLQLGLAYTLCLRKYFGDKAKAKDGLTDDERRFITLKVTKCRWGTSDKDVHLCFDGATMTYKQTTVDHIQELKEDTGEQKKTGKRVDGPRY